MSNSPGAVGDKTGVLRRASIPGSAEYVPARLQGTTAAVRAVVALAVNRNLTNLAAWLAF
jgi:hypothetical protein